MPLCYQCVYMYALHVCCYLTLLITLTVLPSVTFHHAYIASCFLLRVTGERDVSEPLVSAITDPAATYSKLCSLPGILLVVTLHEVFLFDPATLAPLTIDSNSKPLQMPPLSVHDNVIVPSGGAVIDQAAVLWVRDLTENSSGDGQQNCLCEAALGLDSLLIVIRREARCVRQCSASTCVNSCFDCYSCMQCDGIYTRCNLQSADV